MHDVFDGLTRHRLGGETNEVTRMTGAHGNSEFAIGLETANAGAVPGPRIDHDKGALPGIDRDAFRRFDMHQQVIDRAFESAGIKDQFGVEIEDVRHGFRLLCVVLIAALAQYVPVQNGALHGVGHVFAERPPSLHDGVHAAAQVRKGRHRLVDCLGHLDFP